MTIKIQNEVKLIKRKINILLYYDQQQQHHGGKKKKKKKKNTACAHKPQSCVTCFEEKKIMYI